MPAVDIQERCRGDEGKSSALPAEKTLLGLMELFLKSPQEVDALLRKPDQGAELIPKLLAILLTGFSVHGVVLSLLFQAHAAPLPWVPPVRWTDGSFLFLILAYDLGMVAACGICLPSFYFYGLLSGIETSMVQVALISLKGLAATSVLLVGILPVYFALSLGTTVFHAPLYWQEQALYLGLVLPFVAGLWGVRSVYRVFVGLADTLPSANRASRECFLRRLIAAWSACYTAVTPVMIYTLWHHFAG